MYERRVVFTLGVAYETLRHRLPQNSRFTQN
jgi:hypothetical protein